MTPALFLLLAQQQLPLHFSARLKRAGCYDVQSYDITLNVKPASKSISGTTIIDANIVIPTGSVLIDLDDPYKCAGDPCKIDLRWTVCRVP
ncbi:MAG: hypothetical protein R2688_02610 [Fimbriimonadaceae bacterium]